MVSVLVCFSIDEARGKNGNFIPIDDEFKAFGLLRYVLSTN